MQSISIYIISWGQFHSNAIKIANELKALSDKVTIIYSDQDPNLTLDVDCLTERRSNNLFWGDKFSACLDICKEDLMLVIHADCSCDNWRDLFSRCYTTMANNPMIGIWAPLINWVNVGLELTRIFKIDSSSLNVVSQTDAIVFCLSKPIIDRLRSAELSENIYGWGIDTMAVCFAYSHGMVAVIDDGITVNHPKSRGYPSQEALAQCRNFLRQLSLTEAIQNQLLWSIVHKNNKSLT